MIELNVQKQVKVQAKTLCVHAKIVDGGSYVLLDQDGQTIHEREQDYVPGFMPGDHYGDYLLLNIDVETGQITNWVKPSAGDIQAWITKDND